MCIGWEGAWRTGWTIRLKGGGDHWYKAQLAITYTRGMLLGSILRLTPFNIFINDLDNAIKCTASMCAVDMKLGPGGRPCRPNQTDLERLEERVTRNLWNSVRVKASVSTLPWSNPMQQYKVVPDLPSQINLNYVIPLKNFHWQHTTMPFQGAHILSKFEHINFPFPPAF